MDQYSNNSYQFSFRHKQCKKYFCRNLYFWEILIIIIIFISECKLIFVDQYYEGAIYILIIAGIICIPWMIYKIKFRIPGDTWYDDQCFAYIDDIEKEAAENCGVVHLSNEIFTRLTIGGYSGINVKRIKRGKDGKSRSEAAEITVMFFLSDSVRYYSIKFYVLKKGGIARNIGTIYYKDIMSVNYVEEIVVNKKSNCAFKTLKLIMNNGNTYEFAADEDSETERAITIFTNTIAKP